MELSFLHAYATLFVLMALHESGHYLAARFLGTQARFLLFPGRLAAHRASCKLWFLAPLAVEVTPSRCANHDRIVSAAGPLAEIVGMALILGLNSDPSIRLVAYMQFAFLWLNVIPIKALANDGWQFFHPAGH